MMLPREKTSPLGGAGLYRYIKKKKIIIIIITYYKVTLPLQTKIVYG